MWEGGHGESLESSRVLHGQKEDGEELGTFYSKDNIDHLLWTVFRSLRIILKWTHAANKNTKRYNHFGSLPVPFAKFLNHIFTWGDDIPWHTWRSQRTIVSELFSPSLLLVPRLGSQCPYQTSLLAEPFGTVLNGISTIGCWLHFIRSLFS